MISRLIVIATGVVRHRVSRPSLWTVVPETVEPYRASNRYLLHLGRELSVLADFATA